MNRFHGEVCDTCTEYKSRYLACTNYWDKKAVDNNEENKQND